MFSLKSGDGCVSLPPGYYCPNGTGYATQYRCPRGSFSNYTGLQASADCQPCPGGYYCDQEAQTDYSKICDAGWANWVFNPSWTTPAGASVQCWTTPACASVQCWTTPACASVQCWTTPTSWITLRKWVVLVTMPHNFSVSPQISSNLYVYADYIIGYYILLRKLSRYRNKLAAIFERGTLHQPNRKIPVLVL